MKKNQVRISGRKSTWSSAMLSLITVFAMIPAEVGVGTVGWSWRMELEDGKHVEQDEEQHREQGEV